MKPFRGTLSGFIIFYEDKDYAFLIRKMEEDKRKFLDSNSNWIYSYNCILENFKRKCWIGEMKFELPEFELTQF